MRIGVHALARTGWPFLWVWWSGEQCPRQPAGLVGGQELFSWWALGRRASCLLPSGLTSILSGPICKHRQALQWAESAAWPALRARAGRVAQQLSRDQPTPGPALSSQAQRRMAPSPSVRGASGGREGPCADSPGRDPQPTTQPGPQDYLCSSLFPPEVAYLALNPYGSGRQGAGPPKC